MCGTRAGSRPAALTGSPHGPSSRRARVSLRVSLPLWQRRFFRSADAFLSISRSEPAPEHVRRHLCFPRPPPPSRTRRRLCRPSRGPRRAAESAPTFRWAGRRTRRPRRRRGAGTGRCPRSRRMPCVHACDRCTEAPRIATRRPPASRRRSAWSTWSVPTVATRRRPRRPAVWLNGGFRSTTSARTRAGRMASRWSAFSRVSVSVGS